MFKSKSFDLINENELKKRDKLYNPKRCRWINFIVIPALVGFMLLLILANVDFTGTAYLINTTTMITDATTLPTTQMTTSLQFDIDKRQESAQLNIDSEDHDATQIVGRASLDCQVDDNNACKITCHGGVSSIKKTLEAQQRKCAAGTLEVILHYCEFPGRAMKADFLNGNFYLHSLTISNCDLNYIWIQAFNQYSVSNYLKTLILEKTQFDTLDENRFLGLKVINYFRLENREPDKLNFVGASFLKPMAATLNETSLVQPTTRGTKYNPLSWFTGANFVELLRVNLSNNNFPDTLHNTTFSTLTKVQELILANCQIRAMESGTFDRIMETLQYLDLSNNQLTTLSGNFLSNSGNNLKIELSENSWDCTCDNNGLIKFIQTSENDLGEEPRCTSPGDLYGISLKYVSLQCGDIIQTTIPVTTSTTTSHDTTTYTDPNEPQDSSTSSRKPTATSTHPQDTTNGNTDSNISDNSDPNDTTKTTEITTVDSTISSSKETTETTTDPTDTTTTTEITTVNSTISSSTETTETTTVDLPISSSTETTESTAIYSTTSLKTEALSTTTTAIPPTNPVDIVCKDYSNQNIFNQTIRNYDALLGIYSESSTSVVLLVLNDMSKMRLIYFIPKLYYNSAYSETGINSSTKVTSSLCERVVTTTIIHIQGLAQNQTYVFCLVPHYEYRISPFNCRSHQLVDSTDSRESWLRINDIAWLVPVVGIGIFVCVILGSCIVYWLLRRNPTLICGSKRLIKMGCKPREMLLLPKVDRVSVDNQYLSGLAKMRPSVSDEIQSKHTGEDNCDYMQFYKNMEISKQSKMEFLPENLPPSDSAPAIPSSSSCSSRPASTQSTICADDLMQHCDMADLNNIYQSLDHYEHIA